MDLSHFRMLNNEFLKNDPDVVLEQAPLIILDSKSAVCMYNNGKDKIHTRNISICCCCHGPPLKYRFQYGRSRHHCHSHYLVSDTLGRTILCWPLLHKRWSWSHRNCRFRFSEWDAVNVFLPNTPTLVLSCMWHHHTHHHTYLMLSSYTTLTTIYVFFVVPIVPLLWCVSAHIRRVSAHHCPPHLWLPCDTVSFILIIYSLTIARTFRFFGEGTSSPVSAIHFYCFFFVITLFCFFLWQKTANVAFSAIACPFRQGGIPSPTLHYYHCSFRILLSGPPSAIISLSFHYLCCPFTSLVTLHLWHLSTLWHHLHHPRIYTAHCPRSFLCLLARVCVCLSYASTSILVKTLAFSLPPRSISSFPNRPPAAIISPSSQHLCLPLIRATSVISYPYTPTDTLHLNLNPLYLYLSISSHWLSLSFLSHSLSVSIYLSSTS